MRDEDIHVGDILKIREFNDMANDNNVIEISTDAENRVTDIQFKSGVYFNPAMKSLCGKEFAVSSCDRVCCIDKLVTRYNSMNGIEDGWTITADMLEPFDSKDDGEITVSSEEDLMSFLFG